MTACFSLALGRHPRCDVAPRAYRATAGPWSARTDLAAKNPLCERMTGALRRCAVMSDLRVLVVWCCALSFVPV